MPLNIGEIMIGALAPVLETVATAKLGELFEKLRLKDAEGYAATLKSLHIGAKQLERLTDSTKTKIDDAFVDALLAAIEASAEANDIELPE